MAAPKIGAKVGKLPGGAAPAGEGEKKEKLKLEPKQIGIGAAVVVGLALAVIVNLPKGGSGDESQTPDQPAAPNPGPKGPASPAPISGSPITSLGNGSMPTPIELPYTTVVPANSRFAEGTMAILPNKTPISQQQAASLAYFAKQQTMAMKKWSSLQIYVFNAAPSAQSFANYVNQRRGAPLTKSDLQSLASNNAWDGALVCYEYREGRELMRYPANNPSGWWN